MNTVPRVEVEVLAPDASALGAAIEALGTRMFGPADPWERALCRSREFGMHE